MSIAYEDTPIADWLKKNRWILLGGLIVIVAIQSYNRFAPQMAAKKLDRSWSLYNNLMVDSGPTGLDNLNDRLAQARQDERVYPWFVYQMVGFAMRQNDIEALELLRGELDLLAPSARWNTPTETIPLATHMSQQIDARLASGGGEITNPPATGELVDIALTDSNGNSYALVATLYPEAAPQTCAAFLAAVDAGAFTEGELSAVGRQYLTVPGLGDPDADPAPTLPLERKFAYGAAEGALLSSIVFGLDPENEREPGSQSGVSFQMQLTEAHHLDGRQTVFGQITEGLEPILEAMDAVDAGAVLTFSLAGIARKTG
jgi:cyclophilin family peptidyl-prolyl cis-trans isomerase